jgi:citrate lyase subunit beta/citryl-CoA lyase
MKANRIVLRSSMFVPGNRQRMIEKALGLPVDVVMLDIEDGVSLPEKDGARQQIAAALDQIAAQRQAEAQVRLPARFVRVNSGPELQKDLTSVIRPGLDGIVLPKVETAEQVNMLEQVLNTREPEVGITAGSVSFILAIESPRGMLNAYAIASASRRVAALMFGAEDFSRDLGLPLKREGEARDLVYARSTLVMAASAARVQSIDAVWTDLEDQPGLEKYALQSRRLGFSGMALIHPSQLESINKAFTPMADELDYARQVLKAFDEGIARGDGAIAFKGQLLDAPIVDRARQMVSMAESLGV